MDLHVGTAVRDVTPTHDVPLRGYGQPAQRVSAGTHDPLSVKAIAISDGTDTVGLAVADVISIDRSTTKAVEQALTAADVHFDGIVFAATHTHSGPWIPTPAIDRMKGFDLDEPHRSQVSEYLDQFTSRVTEAFRAASESLEPARMFIGRARNDHEVVNRRTQWTRMADCRAPGGGSVDPELITVEFETESGSRTILFNYACHAVCGTNAQDRFSADWPGHARIVLEEHYEDATAIFINGAAGDINPRDRYPEVQDDDAVYDYTRAVGSGIAETAIAAVEDGRTGPATEQSPVSITSRTDQLPVKSVRDTDALVQWIDRLDEEIAEYERADNDEARRLADGIRRHAIPRLRLAEWGVQSISVPLHYLEIGPLGIITVPGEPLVRHGLDFKAHARADALVVAGYANHNIGYIPTLEELEIGGYEVRTSPLSPAGLRQFRESALDLVSGERC